MIFMIEIIKKTALKNKPNPRYMFDSSIFICIIINNINNNDINT